MNKIMNMARKKPSRTFILWCIFLIAVTITTATGILWLWPRPAHIAQPQPKAPSATFKPVVGDVSDPDDADPDVSVEQPLVPAFQFQLGGYTLSGTVIDAQSHQPLPNAVVWIDLPVWEDQPTSIPLHAVTDAAGNYRFIHLAPGLYTVAASRYYNAGRYYAQRVFSAVVLKGNRSGLLLPLVPIATPGRRSIQVGQAKNIILIDLRGFLQHASVLRSLWQPYGWRPLDQYVLLTGAYPQWATYDPWPHPLPWGE